LYLICLGGVSGLPLKQRTTMSPSSSTKTDVPAARIACMSVAAPSLRPKVVALVSRERMAGVALRR
jgi:hypothetical protein